MPKDKSIYDMKLHDMIGYDMSASDGISGKDGLIVTRVPGGWIYVMGKDRGACFVPYSSEFK
ncbi:hypothetical protein LCGC14_1576530 [marine sediment metagenome]|uniref:Uncharacterized protein n=1 Tax=marine sediment metagenome TaxID=412755 RepID=A0A0F9II93_9ZZZZ